MAQKDRGATRQLNPDHGVTLSGCIIHGVIAGGGGANRLPRRTSSQ
jgi:hypothetical protein